MNHTEITARLTILRHDMQQEAGKGITSIEVPLPLLLADVCEYLGLDELETQIVLGPQCSAYINEFMASRPVPTMAIPLELPAYAGTTASGQPLTSN